MHKPFGGVNKIVIVALVFSVSLLGIVYVYNFTPKAEAASTAYDNVIMSTLGGPTYRLKLDGNLTESVSGNPISGAPASYIPTIIPTDAGQSGSYTGTQKTVLTNEANVNAGVTYRKVVSFWTKIGSFGTGTTTNVRNIWEEGGGTNWWSAYTFNNNEIGISIGENGVDEGNCAATGLSTGTLYNVVMQWEASTETMQLWINGVLQCSTTTTTGGVLGSHVGDWEIAGKADARDYLSNVVDQTFIGDIGDYSYWAEPARLLTSSEIMKIYTAGTNAAPLAPTLNVQPFNDEKTGTSTPSFGFTSTDPDGTANIIYRIQISSDPTFASSLVDCASGAACTSGAGTFTDTQNGTDVSPFIGGNNVQFIPTTSLVSGTMYYWRVQAEDDAGTGGSGIYGNWTTVKSLTYTGSTPLPQWFQTTDSQFSEGIFASTKVTGTGSVRAGSSDSYIKVQRGQLNFVSGDLTLTQNITPVGSLSNAFILVWGTGLSQVIERVKFAGNFNSTSQINITRGYSGNPAKAQWEVIEASNATSTPAFTTQTGQISLASASTTATTTITSVNTAQSTVIVEPNCGVSNDTRQVEFKGALSSATQVNVSRTTSGSACTVRYWVVTWAPSITVYNGSTVNSGTANASTLAGTLNLARSVLFLNWDNDTNGLAQHATRGYFSSPTQVTFVRNTSTGSNTVDWSAVEFPVGTVVQADNGTGAPYLSATGGALLSYTLPTAVTSASTMILHSVEVTGTGGALVRAESLAYLTTPTNIDFETQYTGQNSTWSYFAADFSGWAFDVPVTTGTIMSPEVNYNLVPSAVSWGTANMSTTETNGSVKLRVYYTATTPCDTIVPDTALAGNSTGFNATTPIDLSGLNTTTYNKLCLQATLTESGGTPFLNDWGISWVANVPPNAPSQDSPLNATIGVSQTPTFLMTAIDTNSDNIGYKTTIYSNSTCSIVVQTADQAVSGTGWTGSNAVCTNSPASCYSSGTQGSYTAQTALSPSTQYWWKASAKDPDGTNTYTNSSTCNTFTTASAATISIAITSSGAISYGTLPTSTSSSTIPAYTQVAKNDGTGPETFNIKGQDTACPWTLSSVPGADQYVQKFSTTTGSTWTPLTTVYQTLMTGIAAGSTQSFDLQITTPSSTACYNQQSANITIQATL